MTKRRSSKLRSLFRSFFRSHDPGKCSRDSRRIRVEALETRQLLVADIFSPLGLGSSREESQSLYAMTVSNMIAEGEAQDDLVAFAKALRDAGVQFFGADWCPFCTEQKQLFQDGGQFLPFVEVTNPDRSLNAIGIAENITNFPTWEFQNGDRLEGVRTLATISQKAGIPIPKSSTPSAVDIPNQSVRINSPLHIPIDAYDPNGNPLTITVTSSNPSVVTAEVLQGNPSLRLSIEGYGDMVFELFASEAPRPVERIIQLVNAGFYNRSATNKVIFHRVLSGFVIQTGDPTGTGSGGSQLGKFDDQYNVNLQHNRTGVLSYAKSSDDTNDSQFFITEGPQRHLDFNHSIFGQLIEGEAVRAAIARTDVNSPTVGRPTNEIVISSATIFNDNENGLIRLKGVSPGSATITVRIEDTEGNFVTKTFTSTVVQDNVNSHPFLNDIPNVTAPAGTPVNIQLSAVDREGDPVEFSASKIGSVNYTLNVNASSGLVTVTPPSGFVGSFQVLARVNAVGLSGANNPFDSQAITVTVLPSGPTSVELVASSDTGISDSDNITNAGTLTFEVIGTTDGATVELKVGNTVVGTATATGSVTTITTSNIAALGEGTHSIVAIQRIGSQQSDPTPALNVTFDNTPPALLTNTGLPTAISAGQLMSVDLSHPEEGAGGLQYTIVDAPTGMTINPSTGLLQWTPTAAQIGPHEFTVRLTDLAGNVRNQNFALNVTEQAKVGIELRLVDVNNSPITSTPLNSSFKVQVFATDLRTGGEAQGLFAVYLDLLYDTDLVELDGATPVSNGTIYTNGLTSTNILLGTLGVVNELGGFAGSLNPIGPDPKLVAEVRFRAKGIGQAVFTTEAADNEGSDILAYGVVNDEPISPSLVSYGGVTLNAGINFTAVNDSFSVDEDSTANQLNVLANDTIVGSSTTLTIRSVGTPSAGGTVTISSDSKLVIYTPAANFNGTETFTYIARDQNGAEDTATVTVTVQPVNDPPVAVNDTFEVVTGSTNNFLNVLANDNSGPDIGETLTITAVGTPSQGGSVTIGPNGTHLLYTPKLGFTGGETFTYTIRDDGGLTATATVTMNVKSSAPSPVVVNDSFTIAEDAAQAEYNVLANDTPGQTGDTLTISSVSAQNGTASISSDGTKLVYRPKPDFNGIDLVTYVARGSSGGTATGTATFTVTAVNDPPTAVADTFKINSISPNTTLDVLKNDPNVDVGETYTIKSITQPPTGKGTVSISADKKTLVYTPPNNNFTDPSVTFTYTIGDGSGLTSTASVTLEVVRFTTRSISGTIQGGLQSFVVDSVALSGTDVFNQAISRVIPVSNNAFTVNDLAPGTYEIKVDNLPFLTQGTTSLTIVSGENDGNSTGNRLQLGTIRAQYVDIRDFLGRSLGRGFYVAAETDATNQAWLAPQGTWTNFRSISAKLTSTNLAITGTKADNSSFSKSIALTEAKRVDQVASNGSMRLLRVYAEPADLETTNNNNSNGNNTFDISQLIGEGEGGLMVPAIVGLSSTTNALSASTSPSSSNGISDVSVARASRPIASQQPISASQANARSTSSSVSSASGSSDVSSLDAALTQFSTLDFDF